MKNIADLGGVIHLSWSADEFFMPYEIRIQ